MNTVSTARIVLVNAPAQQGQSVDLEKDLESAEASGEHLPPTPAPAS